MKSQAASGPVLSTKQEVEEFERAAKRYLKRNAKSQKTARAALVRMGIVTAKGKLTKPYSK